MTVRSDWIKLNPPNFDGYYFCHICGGWVHVQVGELDHVIPKSMKGHGDPDRTDNLRMSHSWPQTDMDGTILCIGNRQKGSQLIVSATLEIAPGDE